MTGFIEQIAIIGAGKVGTAMGYLLQKAGYGIAAVSDRNPSALRTFSPTRRLSPFPVQKKPPERPMSS
jgi:predicted dinucleotide-binding enzyme